MSMNNYNNNQGSDWENTIPVGSGLPYGQNPQYGAPQNPQYGAPQNPQYGAPQNPQYGVPQPVILQQETNEQFQMPKAKEKKGHGWQIALIAIIAALIVTLAVTLIILLTGGRSKSDESSFSASTQTSIDGSGAPGSSAVQSYQMYAQYEVAIGSLLIDGKQITLPHKALCINDYHYVSLQDFASVFGFFTEVDPRGHLAVIYKDNQRFVFSAGMQYATRINNNVQESIPLEGEPILFDNNRMYVVLRSLTQVFNFRSVEWNEENAGIVIVTDGVTVPVRTVVEETEPNLSLDSIGGSESAVPSQTQEYPTTPALPDSGAQQQPYAPAPSAEQNAPAAPAETPAAPVGTEEQLPYPGYSNLPDISGGRSNLPEPRSESPIGGMAMPEK